MLARMPWARMNAPLQWIPGPALPPLAGLLWRSPWGP